MEAAALHDFMPTNGDELRFSKNQVLKILSMDEDPGWYLAELNGNTGLIPNNYVRMSDHSWYVPNCSRTKAEEILQRRDARGAYIQPDGAFLVRTSETTAPDFSLSVKFGGQVQHFKVLKDDQFKYYLWYSKFDSINQIIQHHRTHSVSQTNSAMLLRDMVTDIGESAMPASIGFSNSSIGGGGGGVGGVSSTRLPPPAPASAVTSAPQRVIALFDFNPQDPDELRFRQNDIITVLGKEDDSWWLGETQDGRRGVFPFNYVQQYS